MVAKQGSSLIAIISAKSHGSLVSFEALHLMYRNGQAIFYQEYFQVSPDRFAAFLVLEKMMNNALAACGLPHKPSVSEFRL